MSLGSFFIFHEDSCNMRKGNRNLKQANSRTYHLMLLPAVILVIIFNYGPMAGLVMAFQDFSPRKGFFGSDFVGLENFRYIFSLPNLWQVVGNTLLISVFKILGNIIFPVLIALMLNEVGRSGFRKSVQTIINFPHFLSWVILSGLFIDILSPSEGIVNKALGAVGIEPIYFLGDKSWFPYTMIITDLWKEVGYGSIVYLATLTAIDPTLYEAAQIDGAGRIRQTLSVTMPALMPTILLMFMLSLGSILNAGGTLSASGSSGFEQIYNLYSPQVYETGDILETLVFRLGLENGQYSIATAIGMVKSIIAMALMSFGYWVARKRFNYQIL